MRVVLSVLAVSVLCQLSWGCCTPKQWRGDMGFLVGTNKNGKGGYETGIVKIFYDAKNTKIAAFSEGVVDGRPFKGGMVQDFEAGVQYTVVNGRCNTTRLGFRKFREACVPSESQALSDTHLGTADDSLDITVYRVPLKRFQGNAFFDITNKLCIPVGETVSGVTPKGVGFMASIGYTGIEPGISDPRVFDKPRECSALPEEGEVDLFDKFGFFNHQMSSLL
ncbi:uncharacterized protein LOC111121485 [Crassostrea virginica]